MSMHRGVLGSVKWWRGGGYGIKQKRQKEGGREVNTEYLYEHLTLL
jgi:hypothetical protein